MNKSQNMSVWLNKMVLAQHFCYSLLRRLAGWHKAQQSLTPAVDWLLSLISLGGLLLVLLVLKYWMLMLFQLSYPCGPCIGYL